MKRIFTILCALALVMAGSATALAADDTGQSASYYPISVEEYTYGDFDELRINKTYQLSLSDDPSLIPTEDFVRNGRQRISPAKRPLPRRKRPDRSGDSGAAQVYRLMLIRERFVGHHFACKRAWGASG